MTDETLRLFEFHYMPRGVGIGINFSWDTFFQPNGTRNKVRYFWISFSFLCWMIGMRIPTKIYGIKGLAR